MMSGVKDGYSVHFPCRHCMASKDQMGNLSTDANGNFEFLKHRLRTQKCLESAKASFHPARSQTSLGFVLDKSRAVFDNIKWKSPFEIYCMTPMCILHVFLSHGLAQYAIEWTQKVP